jgi:hypothetical protein
VEDAPFEAYVAHHRQAAHLSDERTSAYPEVVELYDSMLWTKQGSASYREESESSIEVEFHPYQLSDIFSTIGKENAHQDSTLFNSELGLKTSSGQKPLGEQNGSIDESEEEEKSQKCGPRLWTVEVRRDSSDVSASPILC